jgi:hypothetical protein
MTKRLLVLALFPPLLAAGCAFGNKTSTLGPGEYAAVNERSTRQEATLRLDDGTSRHARNLRLDAGTASFVDPATGAAASLPVERVAEVRYLNRSRGVLKGGTMGFIIGTIFGFAMTFSGDMEWTPAGRVLAGAIVGGIPGWVIGLPIGGAAGADDIYQLPPPRSP